MKPTSLGRLALAMIAGLPGLGQAEDRTADQIVREAEVEIGLNRRGRPVDEFNASDRKTVELVAELRASHPDDPRLARLSIERWWAMLRLGRTDEVKEEASRVGSRATDARLRSDAAYIDAVIASNAAGDGEAVLAVAERFIERAPRDDRAATLLSKASSRLDGPAREKLDDRIIREYPKSLNGRLLAGKRRRDGLIGKPFDLEFTDAISGRKVSMRTMRGKVIVLDFWATWCGPCVQEIPHFQELYTKYHDRGVEFIGVSLDVPEADGGLQDLTDYVREHRIPWPQYYLGSKFEAEFTTSWGIDGIPVSFVVDADGKLVSTEARGKLDELIPRLLEQAKDRAAPQ